MCGPFDDQWTPQPLPEWMEESLIQGRCLPPLGIHEWCEHDPIHPPPVFRDLDEVTR